ncbi:monovalent cation/H+ antiporter subunit D family protein [Halalkalicoccus subterraneus]|uniref:monovalent cation/H+ antiporter subunit D family protein n=1 Tax=Halalkalicoccus subterraneus TaxID=2675002 RepID=UPI000EFB5E63|nr:monovalent cation/H+ antiporter subunit D family protein [Halalkalicoccus subterraneus]
MIENVPVLLVVVPILAATLPHFLGLRYDRAGWTIAALVTTASFGLAIWLAATVFTTGEAVVHQLGGFPRPIGIELVADRLSTPFAVLVTGVSAGVLAYTRTGGPRGNSFYSAYLLLVGGLSGLTLTGDVFNMFVFLEIVGLTTYALISKGRSGESAVAALKYLIIGTVGASLYLIGVGLLFVATGTLNMTDLATAIPEQAGYTDPLVLSSFAFVFIGFAIKIAQFPLHSWQPDAYQHAPDGVTPMVAALVSTVSAYALFRLVYSVFTVEFLVANPYTTEVVVTFGSISVLAGSALAAMQTEVKRILAYSSVSQFGLVVLAYGLVNDTALVGAQIHLLGHAIMKGGLFLAAGTIAAGVGARTVDEYAGLAKRMPFAAGSLAVLGIALVGVPPSIGFVGKWYIAVGAVEAGAWPVAVVVFLSTMFTLAYVARLLEKMYFTPVADRPTSDAVAADGGESGDSDGTRERDSVTDGPARVPGRVAPGTVSKGMLGVTILAALLAVGLGFAGGVFDALLSPFVEVILNG